METLSTSPAHTAGPQKLVDIPWELFYDKHGDDLLIQTADRYHLPIVTLPKRASHSFSTARVIAAAPDLFKALRTLALARKTSSQEMYRASYSKEVQAMFDFVLNEYEPNYERLME